MVSEPEILSDRLIDRYKMIEDLDEEKELFTWAWSVMPMVATEPSCLTHSWEEVYLCPSKTATIQQISLGFIRFWDKKEK